MSLKQFLAGLAITTSVQIIICVLLGLLFPVLQSHLVFISVTILAMILFSFSVYGAAKLASRSTVLTLYIQLIMIAVFLKMLLCLALIVGYENGFNPVDHNFIWPFLMIYLVSTIYEVIFMEKVGREKPITRT